MQPLPRQAYDAEMRAARAFYNTNYLEQAFTHLERAHILGQSFPLAHTKAHWWMLKVGWRRGDMVEVMGQVPRIIGALLLSRMWVPVGNTGGAHVSPFKSMPIPADLRKILETDGQGTNSQ